MFSAFPFTLSLDSALKLLGVLLIPMYGTKSNRLLKLTEKVVKTPIFNY